jgi:hypothetical protein
LSITSVRIGNDPLGGRGSFIATFGAPGRAKSGGLPRRPYHDLRSSVGLQAMLSPHRIAVDINPFKASVTTVRSQRAHSGTRVRSANVLR